MFIVFNNIFFPYLLSGLESLHQLGQLPGLPPHLPHVRSGGLLRLRGLAGLLVRLLVAGLTTSLSFLSLFPSTSLTLLVNTIL